MAEFTKGASTPRTEMLRALMALYVQVPEEVACDVERCFAAYDAKCGEMLEALEDALVMLYADECDVADLEETIGKVERVIREARGQ